MKKLIFISILLIAFGCSGDKPSEPQTISLEGIWSGTSKATYPGPDDGPLTAEEPIRFEFGDSTFAYYWTQKGIILDPPYGQGDYNISGNTITFSNVSLRGYYPPLTLEGTFRCRFADDSLIMTQGGTVDLTSFFETIRFLTLQKSDVQITYGE